MSTVLMRTMYKKEILFEIQALLALQYTLSSFVVYSTGFAVWILNEKWENITISIDISWQMFYTKIICFVAVKNYFNVPYLTSLTLVLDNIIIII